MATYWHKHPRDFANECTLYRATTSEQATRLESLGYTRITRERMRRHLIWMNGENGAWGSGRAIGDYSFRALTDPTDGAYDYHDPADYFRELDEEAAELAEYRALWESY